MNTIIIKAYIYIYIDILLVYVYDQFKLNRQMHTI